MSDTWQGPGWRRADDGKWYPTGEPEPESSPDPSPTDSEPSSSEPDGVADAATVPSRTTPLPPPPGRAAPRPGSVPAGSVACELCHRPMDATALRCPRCGRRHHPPTAPMPSDDWVG